MITTARGRGDAGETLIEILIAVVVIGLAVVAIVGGMMTSILTSSVHQQESEVQTVATNAVERVNASGHVACQAAGPSTSYSTAATAGLPSGWTASTVQIVSIQYWDGTGFGNSCFDNAAEDPFHLLTLQQIKIRVTHPSAVPGCMRGPKCTTMMISFVKV